MCQFANVSITCIVIDSLANCFIGKWSHCIIILVAKICLHNPRFVWWLVYQLQVHWACSLSRITVWVTPPLPFTWALTKLSCCSMSCTSLFSVSFLAFCLGQCSEALSYHKRLGDIAPKKQGTALSSLSSEQWEKIKFFWWVLASFIIEANG